jgi:hypothetical protein
MREVKFSQTHRRSHKHRNFVVSQFDDTAGGPHAVPAVGLAWHYIMQAGDDGAWTPFRRVNVALDARDDEVALTVARDLASPGWDRDKK